MAEENGSDWRRLRGGYMKRERRSRKERERATRSTFLPAGRWYQTLFGPKGVNNVSALDNSTYLA